MSERDEWVLVKSFDELFVGCAVRFPNKRIAMITAIDSRASGCKWCGSCVGVRHTRTPPVPGFGCVEFPIRNRGLYRLRPDEPAASGETANPVKVRKPVAVMP